LYDDFAGIAWQFLEKPWQTVKVSAWRMAEFVGRIANPGFICLTSRYTRLGLFYSLASGGGSVTIIRKSPDCLFSVGVSGTINRQADALRFIAAGQPQIEPEAGVKRNSE